MDNFNQYKIIGEPMLGGMGAVYHLRDNARGLELAMKQPLEKYMQTKEKKEMFVAECEKWMSLGVHPHIVQCYYVGEVDNKMSALMEWMPTGTLKDVIKSKLIYRGDDRHRLLMILEIALQIAIGLRYSHSKGILHLDMKPANVLVGYNWNVKISDFGISNYINKTSDKVMYTPLYCAPEQKANKELSEATDIYCYGVTLLHLICGEAVWYDGIAAGIAHNTILKKYAKIKIPGELQQVLDKCLQKNIEDRFSGFDEVIELLGRAWDNLNIGSIYKYYPEFSDNDANSLNNLAISYYNLNNIKKASNYWYNGYNKHPYHVALNFNYRLYSYLYNQQTYDAITNYFVDYITKRSDENYYNYLQSRFAVTTLAYEKAKTLASKVKNNTINTSNRQLDIYLSNYEYILERYKENGPKILFEMNLKNILKVDVSQDCIYLGIVEDNHFLYVSKTGKLTFIDLKNKKINHGQSGLGNLTHACMSQDGQYLALANHEHVYVYNLKTLPIKLMIKHNKDFSNLKQLCFIKQQTNPVLLMRTGHMIYDIKISNNSVIKENTNYSYLMNNFKDYYNIAETYGGVLCVFSKGHTVNYDIYTKEEISKKFTYHLNTLKEDTIKCLNNTPYVFFINNKNGYSVYDTFAQMFISEEEFEDGLSQFFLSEDNKTMVTLEKDSLRIRRIPDYSFKEKPCFVMTSFKTTSTIMDEIHKAKVKEKETYVLLNEKELNKQLIQKNIGIVRDTLDYPHYLELSGLAAYKLGFDRVQTRLQFTNETKEYYPFVDGYFVDDNFDILLSLNKVNNQVCKLKNSFDKELADIPAVYENILGLSKDYCYIVCAEPQKQLKYRLIELEWLVDWGE